MAGALYNNCGQFYVYAGKTSPCGGLVHQVQILWKKAKGYVVDTVNHEDGGLVCDKHMAQFENLGKRDEFRYDIVHAEVVGSISSRETETGGPKEKE